MKARVFIRYINGQDFQRLVADWMRKEVYDQILRETAASTTAAPTA